jgi:hypothetical protein
VPSPDAKRTCTCANHEIKQLPDVDFDAHLFLDATEQGELHNAPDPAAIESQNANTGTLWLQLNLVDVVFAANDATRYIKRTLDKSGRFGHLLDACRAQRMAAGKNVIGRRLEAGKTGLVAVHSAQRSPYLGVSSVPEAQ